MSEAIQNVVLSREHSTPSGHRIGFVELNAERTLNSLTLDSIRALAAQLRQWAEDPRVVLVVLSGAGQRAFCAGADIRRLRAEIAAHAGTGALPGLDFFAEEYRLDFLIHRYPKPLLVWGSGVVMGGGLGLMVGASHRIVTETTRIAMPEVKIGLFPDVGGSFFLGRMPRGQGTLVGMTGATLTAQDALTTGLADYFVASSARAELWTQLERARWQDDVAANRAVLRAILQPLANAATHLRPASHLQTHAEEIAQLVVDDFDTTYRNLVSHRATDDWLKSAIDTLAAGSPTSAMLAWELQRRLRHSSLAAVFQLELVVAVQCCAHPDFSEGVRALLVDKDNAPRWSPARVDELTPQYIAEFFEEPWSVHPLRELV